MEDVQANSTPAPEAGPTVDAVLPNRVHIPMTQPDPALSDTPQTTEEASTTQEAPAQQEKTESEAAQEVAEAAGLDYDAIVSEYQTSGGISDETRTQAVEAVTKLGLPAEVVDRYFDNLNARSELLEMKAYQLTGGEEGYKAMADWARTSLSDQERTVYSELVKAGDDKQALTAVSMLYEQYKKTQGLGGNRLKASNGSPSSGPMFHNQKELAEAYRNPEVAKSPTLQREIQDRLRRSIAAGVYKQ